MGNSKRIGNNYERDMSRKLSEWFTGEPGSDVIWRDQGSGSRFTTRKKKGLATAYDGDLKATDPRFNYFFDLFSVDTKSLTDINLYFLNPNNQRSNKLLQEYIDVSSKCPEKKIPIMIVKVRDDRRISDFIMFPSFLKFSHACSYMYYEIFYNDGLHQIIMMDLEKFLAFHKPIDFYENNKGKIPVI